MILEELNGLSMMGNLGAILGGALVISMLFAWWAAKP
jgi:hypothetical protein